MLTLETLVMNLFVLSLTLGTAFGGERLDEKPWNLGSYLGFVESVSLDKKVSVPGLIDKHNLYIEAKTPDNDRSWYFQVSTESTMISVSDEFVKSNNLKVQIKNQNLIPFPSDYGVGGQIKTVIIPTLNIGDMTLNNVQAMVSSSKGKFGAKAAPMQLGLAALDVAYTIAPSSGTLSFAPSTEGNTLIKATGTPITYENVGWAQVRYGKKKKISAARHLLISSKISGIDVLTSIEAGRGGANGIAWGLIPEDTKRFIEGQHLVYGSVSVPGLEEELWFTKLGKYHFSNNVQDASLARNVLHNYELSVSPVDQTLALKKTTSGTWATLDSAKIPYLIKQTEPDEEGNEAEASDWSALAKAYLNDKKYDEAIKAQQKVVELAPVKCDNWQTLALAQYKNNDVAGALKSYQEASTRYHKWWDIDLDTRLEIQKSQKLLEKEEVDAKKEQQKGLALSDEPVWHHKQASSCHTTDGNIAAIQLSKEQFDDVTKTYKKLDLDARLAVIQGNSALIQGQLDSAESAYRQAIRLEDAPSVHARVGLALYFADQGEWRFADPLFAEAFALKSNDAITASLWFDNARANGEDTLKKAMDLKKAFPKSSAAHFLALREASILQNTEALGSLGTELPSFGLEFDGYTISNYVRSFVVLGKTEEAQKLLSEHPSFAGTAEILVAQADLAAYSGDSTKALELLKQAAQKNPNNPAIALFLR